MARNTECCLHTEFRGSSTRLRTLLDMLPCGFHLDHYAVSVVERLGTLSKEYLSSCYDCFFGIIIFFLIDLTVTTCTMSDIAFLPLQILLILIDLTVRSCPWSNVER